MAERRKMMSDVTFMISEEADEMFKVYTYNRKFTRFNCEISKENLFKKMDEISYELNNRQPEGCYGCLFCID